MKKPKIPKMKIRNHHERDKLKGRYKKLGDYKRELSKKNFDDGGI